MGFEKQQSALWHFSNAKSLQSLSQQKRPTITKKLK